MNFGLLAYATKTGLGYQTRAIYDNLKPSKTMWVDLSGLNGVPLEKDWYPDAQKVRGIPNRSEILNFLKGLDAIFVCETPLNYELFTLAKRQGIRIIQQFNPEFFDYFKHPQWTKPDVACNPTTYMWGEIDTTGVNQELLRVPFNQKLKKNIKEVKTITHIVGRPTYQDRNGTIEFIKMAEKLGDRYNYEIFMQEPTDHRAIEYFRPVKQELERIKSSKKINLIERKNVQNNNLLYYNADLLVLPRSYAGLCLPMNEALSFGIPVIMTNISPNADLLPDEWLCNATLKGSFEFHARVDVYKADVCSLVQTANRVIENIEQESTRAYEIAQENTWDKLRQDYIDTINAQV